MMRKNESYTNIMQLRSTAMLQIDRFSQEYNLWNKFIILIKLFINIISKKTNKININQTTKNYDQNEKK